MEVLEHVVSERLTDRKQVRNIKKGFLFFRALNHPIRQSIVDLIIEEGEMNVTNLQIKLRIDQAIVSQQLAILREAKVVRADRRGQFIYYTLNAPMLESALDFSAEL